MCLIPAAMVAVSDFNGTINKQFNLFVAFATVLWKQHADWPSNMMRPKIVPFASKCIQFLSLARDLLRSFNELLPQRPPKHPKASF